jgi:hypothetical protein
MVDKAQRQLDPADIQCGSDWTHGGIPDWEW